MQLRQCGPNAADIWRWINRTVADGSSARLPAFPTQPVRNVSFSDCYLTCSALPACMVSIFNGQAQSDDAVGSCFFLSEAASSRFGGNPSGLVTRANSYTFYFKRCDNAVGESVSRVAPPSLQARTALHQQAVAGQDPLT